MKIAYLGTPEFAVPTLRALIESRHEVAVVVSQPDRPAGRGQRLAPTPVKAVALEAGIPVLQPESAKAPEFREELAALGVDAAVVVAYGQILPAALLSVPRFGFLNVHASLLPKYRGAAPIQWAVARGERQTGVTIMQIEQGLDSGPIIAAEAIDILDDDDARSVADMLSMVGARLMVDVLDDIEAKGRVDSTPQDHALATKAPMITRDDARIDWNRAAEDIICQVRGFVVWPGARTERDGEAIKILGAEGVPQDWTSADWRDERVSPGTVVEVLKGAGVVVKCGQGLVALTRVQFPGKKPMDALDAVNGGLLKAGDRLK
jgi:methionyl-tRNA formyltransferase